MKKVIAILLSAVFLQSCFTWKRVSYEPILQKRFEGKSIDAVTYEFGQPNEIRQTDQRYYYIYNIPQPKSLTPQQTTFVVDNNDYVRSVQSNQSVIVRRFSGGKTALAILLPVAGLIVIGVSAASSE